MNFPQGAIFPSDGSAMDSDIADDGLEAIVRQKRDLCDVYSHARLWDAHFLTMDEIAMAEAVTEETFDDLYHARWNRLRAASGDAKWGNIPSFAELRQRASAQRPAVRNTPIGLAAVEAQMRQIFNPKG